MSCKLKGSCKYLIVRTTAWLCRSHKPFIHLPEHQNVSYQLIGRGLDALLYSSFWSIHLDTNSEKNEVVNPVFLQKTARRSQGQIVAVWICMFNISLMNVFVECHNDSACILYMCVIKNKNRATHAHWDQLLLTNRASWWHNNDVGEINTQHREKEGTGAEQRDRKRKEWKSEMNEMELGFHPWNSGGGVQSPKAGDGMGLKLGRRVTNAKNHLLNRFISNNYAITKFLV